MCLHKGLSKATIKGLTPDYAKCQSKYAAAFAKTEAKSACATNGDTTTVEALIDDGCAEVEADLIDLRKIFDDFQHRRKRHFNVELIHDACHPTAMAHRLIARHLVRHLFTIEATTTP